MICRRSPFAFAAMLSVFCVASSAVAQTVTPPKPAGIWYTEEFTVHSKIVGRDFLIQVAKPAKTQAGTVPVIYVLDGNNMFGEVADMVTSSGYFGDGAPAYVVGIGYPAADFAQWLSLRNHDLLHVRPPGAHDPAQGSADGAQFQKFLSEEVRPLIASRYPVDEKRTILAGHSYGGLFTLHVLLNDPGAFNDYLICSPSVWADPSLLEKASSFHSVNHPRIFIGVGSKEEAQFGEQARMVKNAEDLAARLKDHVADADLRFVDIEGQNHGTVVPECLSDGLQFMLPAPAAQVAH